jgi:hypothetical protein
MEADWEAGNIRITADGGFSVEEAELDAARYLSITGKIVRWSCISKCNR